MTFKDDIDDDLGNMLSDDEFGTEITYIPQVGDAFTVNVLFDNEYEGVEVGDEGAVVTDQKPMITVRLSDFTNDPAVDDECTINSVDYKIIDIQKDGTGAADLILELK